ncbi:hypothetical protein GALMADRAFT_837529 [Galerina marginata CBS 339.88]|uniref:Uncharacterized protein n=1 Tax=Galerina marginata (strain CBS 339.88) TaxID=685588 RepID=A0A067TUJ1_GALM3|nr:hypothetical protein GALMADRAFT_837529 [Galerina marginata CBS 339.88]
MGFFSSRKAEDNDGYQFSVGVAGASASDKGSVVKVIRSRFYGKKGKEREDQPISYLGGVSAAQALSSPTVPVASNSVSSPARREAVTIRTTFDDRPLPDKRPSEKPPPSSPISRPKDTPGSSSHLKTDSVNAAPPASPRKNTDTVTVTLAQRLNELAVANSEGLLNDDEYRILRQNVFERFASNAAVPIEAPVVPASPARLRPKKAGTPDRPSSRPLSNFQVETRPMSISSKASASSNVTDLFRRATGRRSHSKDLSDNVSLWSSTSNTSFFKLPRVLSKKSSNSSIATNASRMQTDAMSIASRHPGSVSEHVNGDLPPPAPRSHAGSIRRLGAPPSSFPNRAIGQDTRNTTSIYNVFDEDHLTTVKEINQEISNVEAEAKGLMDAFNGLEVTTLAKSQRHHVRPSLKSSADFGKSGYVESSWGDSDGKSQRRINLADDAMSMRSGTSSVAPSLARSAYSTKKITRAKSTLNSPIVLTNSRPGSLHRKNSASSVTSERKGGKSAMAPPVPALPNSISHGHLKAANGSNISLVRSAGHLPMNTVPEDDKASTIHTNQMGPEELETELDDIRRRREEVSQRYEARLEYLRAKLKGAQLHEKLMRK